MASSGGADVRIDRISQNIGKVAMIDLTLLTGFGDEEKFIGIGIDISLGAFPFEESMISRARYREYLPTIKLKICSA